MNLQQSDTNILIVDDEPNIIVAVEFLLKQGGYEVIKAYNGNEALHAMNNYHPEVVILDVMMPGIDGYEVARKIRSNPAFDDVRIIFLTAKGTLNDRFQGYANGGEIYLTKPFDNYELLEAIHDVVAFG